MPRVGHRYRAAPALAVIKIHRPLRDDRHVGCDGCREASDLEELVDVNASPRRRRDGELLEDGLAILELVAERDRRRLAVGVLQQDPGVERGGGRAFGQVPGCRRGAHSERIGAVVPEVHGSFGEHGIGRIDANGELPVGHHVVHPYALPAIGRQSQLLLGGLPIR